MIRRSFLSLTLSTLPLMGSSISLIEKNDDAKLTKVSIRFDTHNDNKDHDSRLNVSVKNKKTMFLSQDLAEAIGIGGDNMELGDPSSRTFDLSLKSGNIKMSDIVMPLVNIHIQPNGHDRWIFDYTITLTFDDGNTFSSTMNGVLLDQDNRDHTGVFQS